MDTFFTEIFYNINQLTSCHFHCSHEGLLKWWEHCQRMIFLGIFSFCGRVTQGLQSEYCPGDFPPGAIVLEIWTFSEPSPVNFLGGCWGSTGQVFLFQSNTLLSCPGVKLLCIQSGAKSQCPQSQVGLVEKWPQPVTPSPVQRAKMIPWGTKPVSGWQSGVHWYSLRERDRLREPVQVVCRRITWPNAGE